VSWVPPSWWESGHGHLPARGLRCHVSGNIWTLCVVVPMESSNPAICVLSASEHFSDYRDQLVTWEEYAQLVDPTAAGRDCLPDATQFVPICKRS